MASRDLVMPVVSERKAVELSLTRLYMLRVCYLILAVGLGAVVWPSVLVHSGEFALRWGIQMSLLAGLGLAAVLGLRHPLRMLPLLLFELLWKTIYLLAFALPLWRRGQINAAAAADVQACLVVVIFVPLIPWGYVWARYVTGKGERWH